MKKKSILLLALACITMGNAAKAQNNEHYYLKYNDVASSLKLLPAPPQPGSAYFNYDEAQYKWGKMQRITPRGKQAFDDADLNEMGLSRAFSEAFGITISKENTPEIYKLMTHMQEDAGDLATREAKGYYTRMRPSSSLTNRHTRPTMRSGWPQMVLTPLATLRRHGLKPWFWLRLMLNVKTKS